MCDLYSWGEMLTSFPGEGLKKGDIIFLTDDMIEAKHKGPTNIVWEDNIGHVALANYYGIRMDAFAHCESSWCIPEALAKEVNAGHCKKMARGFDDANNTPDLAVKWRFTTPGKNGTMTREITSISDASVSTPKDSPIWEEFYAATLEKCGDTAEVRRAIHLLKKAVANDDHPFGVKWKPINWAFDSRLDWSDYAESTVGILSDVHSIMQNCTL